MSDLQDTTGTWKIDPTHTTLGFVARHAMVAKVRGRFAEFEGSFTLDGKNPGASSAEITIKAASVDTNTDARDDHLRSADFFDVETYPEWNFVGTTVKHIDGNDFVLGGDLTVRGTTRPIELDVTLLGVSPDAFGGTRIGFEGSTEISRKDFGLTWNSAIEAGGVMVGDKIKIEIDVEGVKQ